MEGILSNQLLSNRAQIFNCKNVLRQHTLAPLVQACSPPVTEKFDFCLNSQLPKLVTQKRNAVKICATRRKRISYSRTETYVILEPGEEEKFVSEEELEAKLKYQLENWPGKALAPDLARFASIDDAVSYLVNSVYEHELEGDVNGMKFSWSKRKTSTILAPRMSIM